MTYSHLLRDCKEFGLKVFDWLCKVFAERSKSRYLGDRLLLNEGRRQVFQGILSQARWGSSATPISLWPNMLKRERTLNFPFGGRFKGSEFSLISAEAQEGCGWTPDAVTPKSCIRIGPLDQKWSSSRLGEPNERCLGVSHSPTQEKKKREAGRGDTERETGD